MIDHIKKVKKNLYNQLPLFAKNGIDTHNNIAMPELMKAIQQFQVVDIEKSGMTLIVKVERKKHIIELPFKKAVQGYDFY